MDSQCIISHEILKVSKDLSYFAACLASPVFFIHLVHMVISVSGLRGRLNTICSLGLVVVNFMEGAKYRCEKHRISSEGLEEIFLGSTF